jgi:hypothetical protein
MYYGTRADMSPPPGMSRRTYREAWQRGEVPGTRMPGRGGVVVAVEAWDAWLRAQQGAPAQDEDPIEAAVRRRFKVSA